MSYVFRWLRHHNFKNGSFPLVWGCVFSSLPAFVLNNQLDFFFKLKSMYNGKQRKTTI